MMHSTRPLAIDLFAGAGGMSLGFEQAGFDVIAAIEYDPIHAAVHEFNFPYAKTICADATKLNGMDILQHAGLSQGQVDLVFGGPPCQGFSLMGKRLADDPRNSLVFHFCRLVSEIKPRFVVMENVAGLAIGGAKSVLEAVISMLHEDGYDVRTPVLTLNAAHYGVPQDRKRLFVLACHAGESLPDYPIQTHVLQKKANVFNLPHCTTVQEAIGDLPDIDNFEDLWVKDSVPYNPGPASVYARQLRGDIADDCDFSHPRIYHHNLLTQISNLGRIGQAKQSFSFTQWVIT